VPLPSVGFEQVEGTSGRLCLRVYARNAFDEVMLCVYGADGRLLDSRVGVAFCLYEGTA